jgi:glycosyltransferase involved in cell wall biosynthesis
MNEFLKTAYIEGRPKGHPTHSAYARAVDADFYFVDFRLRYHDRPKSGALRRYLSWVICAITFPQRRKYDVFLSEEAYFMLGIMRKLRLLPRRKKLIALMASHTLYFLHTNRYSARTKRAFLKLFPLYDAFICIGPIEFQLMKHFLKGNSSVKLYQTFNGISEDRYNRLNQINPNLVDLNIITIGSIPNLNRVYYKGIDLMLEAFNRIKKLFPSVTFTVVGDYDAKLMKKLMQEHCFQFTKDVILVGERYNTWDYLNKASLYLHSARGEAWGISVTEAMAAGVVPIVSDWTGAKEAVSKVQPELVVPLDLDLITEKIKWYFGLSLEMKQELSIKCKEVAKSYLEADAIKNFKTVFYRAVRESTEDNHPNRGQ